MAESKIFESGGFVVTTERFVYGTKVVYLDNINGGALPFVDKGWMGTAIISVIGLLMLLFGVIALFAGLVNASLGSIFFGLVLGGIGLLCLGGAYFFFTLTIERSLILSLRSGEGLTIKVRTTEILSNLANAINSGIGERHRLRAGALRDELSNLPRA